LTIGEAQSAPNFGIADRNRRAVDIVYATSDDEQDNGDGAESPRPGGNAAPIQLFSRILVRFGHGAECGPCF
jgi:hypothetical protein